VTLSQVFQTLLDVATEMLHADRGAVFVWDGEAGCLRPRLNGGFSAPALSRLERPSAQALLVEVLHGGEPVVVADALHGLPVAGSGEEVQQPDQRLVMLEEGMRAFANFPLQSDGKVVAVFTVAYRDPAAMTEDVVRLYSALVQRAALSITNMELFEQTKELAVIEVRNRLARDLHDSAKQKAFAALAQWYSQRPALAEARSSTEDHHVRRRTHLVHG
jgi:GAF domain-containing protein